MNAPINFNQDDMLNLSSFIERIVNNNINKRSFIVPVRVEAVDASKMTVDVTPLISQATTDGEAIKNSVLNNISYCQIQSGESAIIIEPTVGDIGFVIVCDKDISTLKETKDEALPASNRTNSISDGIYICGFLNKEPKQIIKFTADKIEITSPKPIEINSENEINIKAPKIKLDGAVTATKTIEATQDITSSTDVKAGITSLKTHVHAGVQNGGGVTGGPQ